MYCQNKCIHIESPYGTLFSSQIDKVQFNDRADHIFLGLYIELMLKAERAKALWIKSLKYCVIIYSSLSLSPFIYLFIAKFAGQQVLPSENNK